MPSINLLIDALVILVGLRSIWQGVRGLRGQAPVRSGWLTGLLDQRPAAGAGAPLDPKTQRLAATVRLVMGIVAVLLGTYLLISELAL